MRQLNENYGMFLPGLYRLTTTKLAPISLKWIILYHGFALYHAQTKSENGPRFPLGRHFVTCNPISV